MIPTTRAEPQAIRIISSVPGLGHCKSLKEKNLFIKNILEKKGFHMSTLYHLIPTYFYGRQRKVYYPIPIIK